MSYLTIFLVGLIIGLLVDVLLTFYFSKRTVFPPEEKPEKSWATKDDISNITIELEKIKNLYKTNHEDSNDKVKNNEVEEIEEIEEIPEIDETSDAEKEFYESIARED